MTNDDIDTVLFVLRNAMKGEPNPPWVQMWGQGALIEAIYLLEEQKEAPQELLHHPDADPYFDRFLASLNGEGS